MDIVVDVCFAVPKVMDLQISNHNFWRDNKGWALYNIILLQLGIARLLWLGMSQKIPMLSEESTVGLILLEGGGVIIIWIHLFTSRPPDL